MEKIRPKFTKTGDIINMTRTGFIEILHITLNG